MALGHRIGLHFDADYHRIRDLETLVTAHGDGEARLARRSWREVEVFSFHMTTGVLRTRAAIGNTPA
jgi:hypothetical protein